MNKYKLQNFEAPLKKLRENNEIMSIRLLMGTLTEDSRLIEIVKAINNIVDYENYNPIYEYSSEILKKINEKGRLKYGKTN